MNIIGKTETGQLVVGDIFKFFDTHGLPLADIFSMCIVSDFQPCWINFYTQAKEHGWKHKTIMLRLADALNDSYGADYTKIVIERLESKFN
jgi:hypothetical protein